MTLQEILSNIRTAIYGEDVINAILNGLKLCYSERLSGGRMPSDDLNEFANGSAIFEPTVDDAPYDNSFLILTGGNEETCCQVAFDTSGVHTSTIHYKENGSWTQWKNVGEPTIFEVSYYNRDGSRLLFIEEVIKGNNAVWAGTADESSEQYDYHSIGWNLQPNQSVISEGVLNNITASIAVYAACRATLRSFCVRCYSGLIPLSTQAVIYGENATPPAEIPQKASTQQYDYTFIGWNRDPNATAIDPDAFHNITEDRMLYAVFSSTLRSHNVTFKNGDEVLQSKAVPHGETAVYNGVTPTKESTTEYYYNFIGWSTENDATVADPNATHNITSDTILYAVFSSTIAHNVTFKNGDEVLQSKAVPHGETAVYNGVTPTKESTTEYYYNFIGWSTENDATVADPNATHNITSDTILYAVFSTATIAYIVRFMNGAEPLETISVEYGHNAIYSGNTPAKDATDQYTYSFIGWNTDPNAVSADNNALSNIMTDRDVYAIFSSTLRTYNVTFKNGAEPLETISVEYGHNAIYSGNTPAKDATDQYTYSFIGWNTDPNAVSADNNALSNIMTDRDVYAIYNSTIRSYTVYFVNGDRHLGNVTVPFGEAATYSGSTPTKTSSKQYDYTFVGWNRQPDQSTADTGALTNVTSNRYVYAAFLPVTRTYTVRFLNGSIEFQSSQVEYGGNAVYSGEQPTKESTAEYDYRFVGWNSRDEQTVAEAGVLENITANKTVYAAFSQSVRQYIVRFMIDDETVLETVTVPYGSDAVYSGETPVHPSNPDKYTFNIWEPDGTNIIADTDCQATWLEEDW